MDNEDTAAESIYNRLEPVNAETLSQAIARGMLKKTDLVDGSYYSGYSRNASVAKWNAEKDLFQFLNSGHFPGDTHPDDVVYPSDYDGFDIFVPMKKVTPKAHQIYNETDWKTVPYKGNGKK